MTPPETSPPFSLSILTYRRYSIPADVRAGAMTAASQVGYDQFEENFLGARILKIQWISEESIRSNFPEFLKEPCNFDPTGIVRIDWQTWAIAKRFDGQFEKSVIERVESIVVALETLRAGEVFMYELGPEYNWLYWEEDTITGKEPPVKVFDALRVLIEGEWRTDVLEYFEGDDAILDGVHRRLRPAISRVLRAKE